jgi:hypothetical protein
LTVSINLLRKNIITDAICPRCHEVPETNEHLFYHCPLSRSVWHHLGIAPESSGNAPWASTPTAVAAPSLWPAVVLTILWKLWDSRNSVVFRRISLPTIVIIRNILDDFTLWSHRLRKADSWIAATIWRDYLSSWLAIHVTRLP